MCGICGIVNFKQEPVDPVTLNTMTRLISHRGPDDEGHVLLSARSEGHVKPGLEFKNPDEISGVDLSAFNIGLGFRRLSIIDLTSAGNQPMANEDGSIWIVFNGEFYNSGDYVDELDKKGHRFRSRTDTEVVIHLYEEYGIDEALRRMNGMFAFALYDCGKNRLLLVRDRVGIKPLYYYLTAGKLIFASEVKSVLASEDVPRRINTKVLGELLGHRYVNAPETFFEGIKKLKPGHYISIDLDSQHCHEVCYWSVLSHISESGIEDEHHRYLSELTSSISLRLRSDVPLGVFLSGGLDSSTLTGVIRRDFDLPCETFSVGFSHSSGMSESWASNAVASHLGSQHHPFYVDEPDLDLLPEIAWHLEEPICDPAILPTYQLSQLTREFVSVALAGEGSDETNYGYQSYLMGRALLVREILPFLPEKLISNHFLSRSAESASTYEFKNHPLTSPYTYTLFKQEEARRIINGDLADACAHGQKGAWWRQDFKARTLFDVTPLVHFHTWLPDDLLLKVDKMSMAHSLEVRVPYLDHRAVVSTFNTDTFRKLRRNQTKVVLRNIAARYLPSEIIHRKQHGFLVPLQAAFERDLFQKPGQSKLREFAEGGKGVFDFDLALRSVLDDQEMNGRNVRKLFLLVVLGLVISRFKLRA